MPADAASSRRTLFRIFCVALALRLVVMLFIYRESYDPQTDFWSFGFEVGRVARSVATGHGFGNPLYGPTGPTAWFGPVYPCILAIFFKLFGVYSKAACFAILSFNSLVSALTCVPIFFLARRGFGDFAAQCAAWLWAFFPDAIYGPNARIWDTWLAALLLATLFLILLKLENSSRVRDWFGFGLLAGVAALTTPVLLSVLPLLALWMVYRRFAQRKRWLAPAIAAVLAVILVVSPWMVRNFRTFHRFIPIGDSLGLEFGIGNTGDTSYLYSNSAGPWNPWQNDTEWREFQQLGEVNYFQLKGREGASYIRNHPAWYAVTVARRIVNIWTNFWSFSKSYRQKDPFAPLTVPLYTLLSVLTLLGLCRAFREKGIGVAVPYAIVLFFFPIIYYLTHTGDWYRRPIDPFFVALAACELVDLKCRRKA